MKRTWISCNTCGADDYQVVAADGDWPIGRCAQCGQVYVNPIPIYEPRGESKKNQRVLFVDGDTAPGVLRHDEIQLKQYLAEIRRLTDRGWLEVKFLDIGCSSGSSIKAATQLGWDAIGLDNDEQLIAEGQQRFGVDLRCTSLIDARLPDNRFHFVRLRDVIEDLPNPYEVLQEIRRILVPDGVLLLATPNEDALTTKIRLWLNGRGADGATSALPRHLHAFTPETISRILIRTGFNIMEVKTTTPVDPDYVKANYTRFHRNPTSVLIWKGERLVGRGSMLVAWAKK